MIRNYFLETLGKKLFVFFAENKSKIQELMDLIFLPNKICKIFNKGYLRRNLEKQFRNQRIQDHNQD